MEAGSTETTYEINSTGTGSSPAAERYDSIIARKDEIR
jgi:hypothetical protein